MNSLAFRGNLGLSPLALGHEERILLPQLLLGHTTTDVLPLLSKIVSLQQFVRVRGHGHAADPARDAIGGTFLFVNVTKRKGKLDHCRRVCFHINDGRNVAGWGALHRHDLEMVPRTA